MNRARILVSACLTAAAAATSAAPAGRVDFAVGRVEARGPDGQARLLVRGAEVSAGDSVATNDGRAQIRFTDGGYVSLGPNSEFGIREYAWDGRADGSERGFFSLVKGVMRTVTGLVGRSNKQAYELKTPTATIGIRGTGGVIAIGPDGSTQLTGTSGIWVLSNAGGSIDVPAGASGLAGPDLSRPPARVAQPAIMPPVALGALPSLPNYAEGDQRGPRGFPSSFEAPSPTVIAQLPIFGGSTPPASGSGGGSAGGGTSGGSTGGGSTSGGGNAGGGSTGGGTTTPPTAPAAVVYYVYGYKGTGNSPDPSRMGQGTPDPNGVTAITSGGACTAATPCERLTSFADPTLPGTDKAITHVASAGEFGTDGPLSWGRWQGAANIGADRVSFSSKEGLHYVTGIPTPNISQALGTVTYTLIGATTPTLSNATGGPGESFTGTLRSDFLSNRVALEATVTTDRTTSYSMVTPGGLQNPGQSPVTIDPRSAGFAGSFVATGTGCAAAPCAAAVQGGFFGIDATHAGMTYQITAPAGVVGGAAAFRR